VGLGATGHGFLPRRFRAEGALEEIAEAGHVGGFQARPRENERQVIAFFGGACSGRRLRSGRNVQSARLPMRSSSAPGTLDLKRGGDMSTIPHEPSSLVRRSVWLDARDMWAALAIVAIWLAVLFTAVFGPDFVSTTPGGNSTTIPSGIGVAFFALFATMSVAKYGFSKRTSDR
jgi:hypothetical protein